jgi:hypothetical protein
LDYADYKPEGTLFIIPVRLEECTPPKRLARWQYADYFEGQRESSIQKILFSLKNKFGELKFDERKTSKESLEAFQPQKGNVQLNIYGDVINSILNAGDGNQSNILREKLVDPAFQTILKKANATGENRDGNKDNALGEQYEMLVASVGKQLNHLPKIVVYCLYKYFSSNELEVNLRNKLGEANKAAENDFLIASD